MFTGIVEQLGRVKNLTSTAGNLTIGIEAPMASELKIDQSVAHNGICLTVVNCDNTSYEVVAISETLSKTNLSHLKVGDFINLERCMKLDDRLDGHLVQGHVDTTATCTSIAEEQGSWRFYFNYEPTENFITVPKGSITVNGVSLTVVDSLTNSFSVAIIPYTFEHTNFNQLRHGQKVNIEFDIIGKYVARLLHHSK
jgi:riboflavin synthase